MVDYVLQDLYVRTTFQNATVALRQIQKVRSALSAAVFNTTYVCAYNIAIIYSTIVKIQNHFVTPISKRSVSHNPVRLSRARTTREVSAARRRPVTTPFRNRVSVISSYTRGYRPFVLLFSSRTPPSFPVVNILTICRI